MSQLEVDEGTQPAIRVEPMTLKVEGKRSIENPSGEQISRELSSLTGERATFAILDRSSQVYIQVGRSNQGFVLEYQNGSVKEHYRSGRTDLSMEEVIETFRGYAAGDDSWKDRHSWSRVRIWRNNDEPSWVRTTSITGFTLLVAVVGIWVALGLKLDNGKSILPMALFTLGAYALVLISIPDFFEKGYYRVRVLRAYAAILMSLVFTCLLIFQIIRAVLL